MGKITKHALRAGRAHSCHLPRQSDCCPQCKTKLKKGQFKVLYKEFLECTACGNNWMAYDMDEVRRFM